LKENKGEFFSEIPPAPSNSFPLQFAYLQTRNSLQHHVTEKFNIKSMQGTQSPMQGAVSPLMKRRDPGFKYNEWENGDQTLFANQILEIADPGINNIDNLNNQLLPDRMDTKSPTPILHHPHPQPPVAQPKPVGETAPHPTHHHANTRRRSQPAHQDEEYYYSGESEPYSASSQESADELPDLHAGDGASTSEIEEDFTPEEGYLPKKEGERMTMVVGPGRHQVKEFNILPINLLRVHYPAKSSDYILVKLICDKKLRKEEREIFMTAVSPQHSVNDKGEVTLPNLKISQTMLPGRTKGFKFVLTYTLISDGQEVERLVSEPFHIWSNVNQKGYPRKERDLYIIQRIKANSKKRRRRN
jgi:hypothetical protein